MPTLDGAQLHREHVDDRERGDVQGLWECTENIS